ncbi:tRNA 5-methylaminomethyl-2-thiouridine synthase [Bradyrhizobium diazoefficiens]|uniref:DUF6894 family protein n=1 Tax=Bradyrhizobium diazoefficiens TaxID=1355477 RepID=UPI00190C6C9F|nr:tRNA 5-methylaminomethyl-2-thiouridine synthase [Bradyrhizobium diazoefficiens]MBK3662157.1 tRNA 5-methylaminomethyl-2-thiouridine synthase [Bradyrhizobium diazoefficiens]
MPQYVFSVRNLEPNDPPIAGEFTDDEAAWKEATHFAADLFRDVDGKLRPGEEWFLEVVDAEGRLIFKIRVSAKLEE